MPPQAAFPDERLHPAAGVESRGIENRDERAEHRQEIPVLVNVFGASVENRDRAALEGVRITAEGQYSE